jgi:hypothetical protein
MLSDKNTFPLDTISQKQPGALQLGPRKKLYVMVSFLRWLGHVDWRELAAGLTHLSIMEGTSDAPNMLCVQSVC